jgi:hypothetical protein
MTPFQSQELLILKHHIKMKIKSGPLLILRENGPSIFESSVTVHVPHFSLLPSLLLLPQHTVAKTISVVKCTLVQALRLCTGRTAHRGNRGIALYFHDHGTRRG